jgi:hypothetical protein
MDVRPNGSQPSAKGPAECFTGNVRIDPLFEAPHPARAVSRASRCTPAANKALVNLISAIAKRKQCDPGNLNRSSRWN